MSLDPRSAHLALPATPARGAVLVLGGSEGGHHPADADALVEAGFAALSWAYFGAPGVPAGLVDIPLEHLAAGLDVLQDAVGDDARLSVVGGSRGGEAALLLAAHDPRVAAVVSVVGSAAVTAGIDFTAGALPQILAGRANAWTLGGRPVGAALPHLDDDDLARVLASADEAPVRLRDTYSRLTAPDGGDAGIPVERSDAAILLVSAADDAMWDSQALSEVAVERLRAHGHPRPFRHVVLDAGHPIAGPPRPPSPTVVPGPGVRFETGGTPDANAAAQREAWRLTLDWLDTHG